jgi:hypothetical protein
MGLVGSRPGVCAQGLRRAPNIRVELPDYYLVLTRRCQQSASILASHSLASQMLDIVASRVDLLRCEVDACHAWE